MLFLCAVSQSAALRRIESEGKRKEMVPMESSLQRTGRSIQDIGEEIISRLRELDSTSK